MTDPVDAVKSEVRKLRRGPGIMANNLMARLGPHLRRLCDAGSLDAGACRRVLIHELNRCLDALPPNPRLAVAVSLNLYREVDAPDLHGRITWLARRIERDYRTAVRRVDSAEQLLAEEILAELHRREGATQTAPVDWHLEELRVLLRLDTPEPEAHENRRIVARRDGLNEVMAWLDVPRGPGQPEPRLSGEVSYGGSLVREERPGRERFQFVVRLPRPLHAGDAHEYGLLIRVPDGEHMRPHYIFTPERPCSMFSLRVRFDPDNLPVWVRRVNGETVRQFDDAHDGADRLYPDGAGEVAVRFTAMALYLGYGVQWGMA
jgi:hypothetical protein